jgi:hypothetical protein
LSIIVGFIGYQQYQIGKDDDQGAMSNTLEIIHQGIEQSLRNSCLLTLTLALTINDKKIPKDFDTIS